MVFSTSQNGINLITSFEGCHTKAYWDKWGKVWTIGYGHTGKDVYKGLIISQQQAENLLKQDIKRFENYVNNHNYVPQKINQNQFDALVSFSFNMGQGNLKKLCANKTLAQIAKEMLLYKCSGGEVLKGLERRRKSEQKLFLSGVVSSPNPKITYQPKKIDIISSTPIGEFTLHTKTILEKTENNNNFLIGDYNHDGKLDLYCIRILGEPEFTEVHIIGGENYQSWLLQTKTPLKDGGADWEFGLGDFNRDGNLDLFCIKKNKTGTNKTEVHILSGSSNFQSFLLQTGTALHETDDCCQFCVGDYNGDGKPDLFYIAKSNTGSKTTEVHILSGASNYQSFLLQTGTILHETDYNWEFGVSNYLGKGKKDLYCVNKGNDRDNCSEIHILNGSQNYQSWAIQSITKMHETDEKFEFYPVDRQLFVISREGASNSTELHAIKV